MSIQISKRMKAMARIYFPALMSVLLMACGGGSASTASSPTNDIALYVSQDRNEYDRINLAWTDPQSPSTAGYEIQMQTPGGAYQNATGLIMTGASQATVLLPDSLPELVTINFRIAPSGSNGQSWSSVAAYFRGPRPIYAASTQEWNGVKLSWSNQSTVATSLTIKRGAGGTDPSTFQTLATLSPVMPSGGQPGQQSFVDTTAAEATSYTYLLIVHAGPYDSMGVLKDVRSGLFTPTGLQVTPLPGGMQLTWTNHSQAATGLHVTRWDTTAGRLQIVATLGPSEHAYLDTGVTSGYAAYAIEAFTSADLTRTAPVASLTTGPGSPLALQGMIFSGLPNGAESVNLQVAGDGTWCMASANAFGLGALAPGGSWTWTPYPFVANSQSQMKVSPQGVPSLAVASTTLHELRFAGGAWTDAQVAGDGTNPIQIEGYDVDGSGAPHALLFCFSRQPPIATADGPGAPWNLQSAPTNLQGLTPFVADSAGNLWAVDAVSGHLFLRSGSAGWQDLGTPVPPAPNNGNNYCVVPIPGGATVFWSSLNPGTSTKTGQIWACDWINNAWAAPVLVEESAGWYTPPFFQATGTASGRQAIIAPMGSDLFLASRIGAAGPWSLGSLGINNILFQDYRLGADAASHFWIALLAISTADANRTVFVYTEKP